MNELALFAGAGGGILGGKLLGWRTVCAVEWEAYPASVLCARQNDGFLETFPIWDDVQTFDGKPWRGIVDVVSGGFPCQDISVAGGGGGSMEKEAECGEKWHGLLARYDQDTHLWRTVQCSLLEDLNESLQTLPQWGMTVGGELYLLPTLVQTIDAKESGFTHVWGTPKAQDSRHALRDRGKGNLGEQVSGLHNGGKLNPTWTEWLMGWPLEWTDLKPLAMDKFPYAQQQHGNYSVKESND